MEIKTTSEVIIFIVFFIPGFIMMKSYGVFIAREKIDFSAGFIEATGFSCLNYAICSPFILYCYSKAVYIFYPKTFIIIAFFIMFIIPIMLVKIYLLFLESNWANKKRLVDPHLSAWDYFFRKGVAYYVIVNLKNGKSVFGVYQKGSYASSYPCKDIYLSEVWKKNATGGFSNVITNTAGVLIFEEEISTIEFIK